MLEYVWEWKKVVEFCLEKKVDGSGIFLSPQQNLTLKNDWFPHAASGAFFVLFFWSFCFSNSKQYERVFVQETKTCFDYSPTAVTIKYKMTFFGNKINKVWRIFECTTYLFCTIKRKSVYWRYTNIFGLLFHQLLASLVRWKFQEVLLHMASAIQCLLFTSNWPIIWSCSLEYFSTTYM